MNLNEAKQILLNTGYILEKVFSRYEEDNLKKYADIRDKNRIKDFKYSYPIGTDENGKYWLNVNAKDFYTIALAFIDGLCNYLDENPCEKDNFKTDFSFDFYQTIKTKTDIDNIFKNEPKLNSYIHTFYNNLKQYFSSNIKLYRGLSFDKKIGLNNELLATFANTNKEYSSYSPDYDIAYDYAKSGKSVETPYFAVISGIAEPKNISFAFSAYMHGAWFTEDPNIHELVVTGDRPLRNIKVEYINYK